MNIIVDIYKASGSNKLKATSMILRSIGIFIFVLLTNLCSAQGDPTDSLPDDPGAMKVYTYQNMNFGTFSNQGGGGGTLTLSNTGTRSATGGIVPLTMGGSAQKAIFEIEVPQNTIISISNGPNVTLTSTNGGTMSLSIGPSDVGSPFTTNAIPPFRNQVCFGGTLTVGNSAASPPGNYTGSLYITFNQE